MCQISCAAVPAVGGLIHGHAPRGDRRSRADRLFLTRLEGRPREAGWELRPSRRCANRLRTVRGPGAVAMTAGYGQALNTICGIHHPEARQAPRRRSRKCSTRRAGRREIAQGAGRAPAFLRLTVAQHFRLGIAGSVSTKLATTNLPGTEGTARPGCFPACPQQGGARAGVRRPRVRAVPRARSCYPARPPGCPRTPPAHRRLPGRTRPTRSPQGAMCDSRITL